MNFLLSEGSNLSRVVTHFAGVASVPANSKPSHYPAAICGEATPASELHGTREAHRNPGEMTKLNSAV
jgi:hypothetical protein